LLETELFFSELDFSEPVFSELDELSLLADSDLPSAPDDELEPLPLDEPPFGDFLA
jgi:hypothetical protein